MEGRMIDEREIGSEDAIKLCAIGCGEMVAGIAHP